MKLNSHPVMEDEENQDQFNVNMVKELHDIRQEFTSFRKYMYSEIKSYEDKLDTADYKNTTIRLLDDLEPLTKYIIEHSGLDPKH